MLKTFAFKLAVVGGGFFILVFGLVLAVAHTLEAAVFMLLPLCQPILAILPRTCVKLLFKSHGFGFFFTVIFALGVIQCGALGGAIGYAVDFYRRKKKV
jgi:hypothetical protein